MAILQEHEVAVYEFQKRRKSVVLQTAFTAIGSLSTRGSPFDNQRKSQHLPVLPNKPEAVAHAASGIEWRAVAI